MKSNTLFASTLAPGLLLMLLTTCTTRSTKDLTKELIIPKPSTVEATFDAFKLSTSTGIYYAAGQYELRAIGEHLADLLEPTLGVRLSVDGTTEAPQKNAVFLTIVEESEHGKEGYELDISSKLVKISASTPAGIFYGMQTLRQLLPTEIEAGKPYIDPIMIASGMIKDKPVYPYRGAMLDVARHFFPVEDVKRYIDLIAAFKFNTLHLHLSDDQGWRIEIMSWPKLAEIGGQTAVGGGAGGFYTQQEYIEIDEYAKAKFITIIPEIDMPGHTHAALVAYPELSCDSKKRELYTGIEVGFSTLCTSSETTYKFIDDVIRELAAITEGPYIHIGGDESLATPLSDYIPFMERVQQIVKKYDKEVIGWDEIANAKLVDNAVVQYWAEAGNAVMGIEQGAKVIMSPATKTYLDMQYDSTTRLGLHWAAYIEVDEAYNWDPATIENQIGKEHILGIEAPLWTETIDNMDDLEYMAFPRLLCHSEVAWTKPENRDWSDFCSRLGAFCSRLEAMEIDYYQSTRIPWK
jgi:hexosaminidase